VPIVVQHQPPAAAIGAAAHYAGLYDPRQIEAFGRMQLQAAELASRGGGGGGGGGGGRGGGYDDGDAGRMAIAQQQVEAQKEIARFQGDSAMLRTQAALGARTVEEAQQADLAGDLYERRLSAQQQQRVEQLNASRDIVNANLARGRITREEADQFMRGIEAEFMGIRPQVVPKPTPPRAPNGKVIGEIWTDEATGSRMTTDQHGIPKLVEKAADQLNRPKFTDMMDLAVKLRAADSTAEGAKGKDLAAYFEEAKKAFDVYNAMFARPGPGVHTAEPPLADAGGDPVRGGVQAAPPPPEELERRQKAADSLGEIVRETANTRATAPVAVAADRLRNIIMRFGDDPAQYPPEVRAEALNLYRMANEYRTRKKE
jgi:hypothetical protein